MEFSKEHLIYAGVGLFALLVLINSTKNVALQEVVVPSTKSFEAFDSSSLPSDLQPPKRLPDNSPLPSTLAKRSLNLNMLGVMPRFDK
jgi:hypothetical protein